MKLSRKQHDTRPVILVTSNIRHLPPSASRGMPVTPVRPNDLLEALLHVCPEVSDVLATMVARFKAPAIGKADLLNILEASNCRSFAMTLAGTWGLTPK
ncbi:MAG: hypothetical protein IPG93_06370 [Burkholderiales bacterium]|nr:hypothetical protein [Burkholderiales bacterium]